MKNLRFLYRGWEQQTVYDQYVTASAEEKQAGTQVQQAKLQLSYTKICSPFDGRVTKKNIEPGNYEPDNYVQPGQTLLLHLVKSSDSANHPNEVT